MWYHKINFDFLKNNKLLNNLDRPKIICYLLTLFVATNLIDKNTSKVNLLVVLSIGVGICYFNLYLGILFLSMVYIQTIVLKKNNFTLKKVEKFQNNMNNTNTMNNTNNMNNMNNTNTMNNTNNDDRLTYVLRTFLDSTKFNLIENDISNFTLEDLIYTNNLDSMLSEIDNDIMSKIIYFKELSNVYLLDYQKIVFLIQNNVNTIQDLNNNIELIDDKNRIGLDYYNEIKVLTDEHHLILYNLYFDNDLFEGKLLTKDNISNSNVIELVDDYKKIDFMKKYMDKNEIIKKILIEGLILLDFYDILDKDTFTPINVTKTIQNLSISTVSDNIFEILSLKHRANLYYSNYLKKNFSDKTNNLDYIDYSTNTKIKDENKEKQDRLKDELLNKEYKELKIMDNVGTAKTRREVDFKNIITDFSNTMIDIIEDILELFSKENYKETNINNSDLMSEDSEDLDDEKTKSNSYFNGDLLKKYIFYFKEIITIFTKEGRMFHSGILLLFISIIIYFVDSTK